MAIRGNNVIFGTKYSFFVWFYFVYFYCRSSLWIGMEHWVSNKAQKRFCCRAEIFIRQQKKHQTQNSQSNVYISYTHLFNPVHFSKIYYLENPSIRFKFNGYTCLLSVFFYKSN